MEEHRPLFGVTSSRHGFLLDVAAVQSLECTRSIVINESEHGRIAFIGEQTFGIIGSQFGGSYIHRIKFLSENSLPNLSERDNYYGTNVCVIKYRSVEIMAGYAALNLHCDLKYEVL